MMQRENNQQQYQRTRNEEGSLLLFGKDVSNDIVFNEEQERQLEKLREEAVIEGTHHSHRGHYKLREIDRQWASIIDSREGAQGYEGPAK